MMVSPVALLPRKGILSIGRLLLVTITAAHAQQTINYTNNETNAAPINVTAPNNPTTLSLSSGAATQSGVISGTGNIDVNAGSGTITLTNDNTYSGGTTVDFGTLAVSGVGASINQPNAAISVGANSGDNGTLLISNGGSVSSESGNIAVASSAVGTVTVTGTGSAWNGNSTLTVGEHGTGFLNILNGGQVSDDDGFIGDYSASTGTVTVSGVDSNGTPSTWTNTALDVGMGTVGSGTLTIQDGGVVSSLFPINLEGGTVNLDSNGVLVPGLYVMAGGTSAINFNGGILRAAANSSNFLSGFVNDTVTLGSGGGTIDSYGHNITVSTNLSGIGGLTKTDTGSGTGTLTLTGNNGYQGPTTVSGGVLSVNSIAVPGTGQPLGVNNTIDFAGASAANPGTLQYTGASVNVQHNLTVASGAYGVVNNTGGGVMTLSGTITDGGTLGLAGGNFIVNSPIAGSGNTSNLAIGSTAGSATVGLTKANTYIGATVISQGSTLLLGATGALPSATPSVVTLGGASDTSGQTNTLDLLGNSPTVAGLFSTNNGGVVNQVINSNGTPGASGVAPAIGNGANSYQATLTVNYSGSTVDTYAGFLGDPNTTPLHNNLALTKTGTGTLALTNANTYTGTTTVSQGTLLLENGANGSATGSGYLTVASGATIGGAGTSSPSYFTIDGNVLVGDGTDATSQTVLSGTSTTKTSSFQSATLQFNLQQIAGSTNGYSNTLQLGATPVTFNNTSLQLNLVPGSSPLGFNTVYTLISTNNAINAASYGLTLDSDGKQIKSGLTLSNASNLGPDYSGAYIYVSGDNIDIQGQLSNFQAVLPPAPLLSSAQGSIQVNLSPANVGGWRLQGEELWRASGTSVSGLTTDNNSSYTVEFEPVPGYLEPPSQNVAVSGSGSSVTISGIYDTDPTFTGTNGGLEIVIDKAQLGSAGANVSTGWRISGQTAWLSSGSTVTLAPGTYLIEGEPVSLGSNQYVKTPLSYVTVAPGPGTTPYTLVYPAPTTAEVNVAAPQLLPFSTQTSSSPYALVGQIRSDAGYATGFVVEKYVVATAAHVVFDDGSLSYVTGLQWIFQRSAGNYDPPPQIPQGYYLSGSYSELRQQALQQGGTAGVENAASENLDVAALYFLSPAGNGGFSGYLASDSASNNSGANEFLVPTTGQPTATLVGYPVDGIYPPSQQGQAFYTPPASATFTPISGTDTTGTGGIDAEPNTTGLPYQVYTTSNLFSVGGNSGGPLCVQYNYGSSTQYYPAAIYLGGNASESVFKAIDGLAVDLFTRAETSGSGGDQHLGGGVTQATSPIQGASLQIAALQVINQPSSAAWGLSSGNYPNPSGFENSSLTPRSYTVYFEPVAGYITPSPTTVTLTGTQLTTLTAIYQPVVTPQTIPAFTTIAPVTLSTTGPTTVTITPPTDNSGSGEPVVVSVQSGPATISGNTVTITGAGTVVLAADQAGNGSYSAAPEVITSFTVTDLLGGSLSASGTTERSPWFGHYTYEGYPLVYQYYLGYEYVYAAGAGVYLYDYSSGHFWYTQSTYFPVVYDFSRQTYLYYYDNNTPHRHFYDYATGTVITE